MSKSIEELREISKRVRRDIVTMITAAKSGHPGGSLSAVEILVELYFNTMRIDPANPQWPDRDRFILSKGHAAPVLYSVMAERGYADTPKDQLNTLRKMATSRCDDRAARLSRRAGCLRDRKTPADRSAPRSCGRGAAPRLARHTAHGRFAPMPAQSCVRSAPRNSSR